MNARILASVSFTIIGVLALSKSVLLLQNLASIPAFAGHFEGSLALLTLGYAVPTVLLIAFGVYLIAKRDLLAQRWVPDADSVEIADSGPIAIVGFAILGLYLFITSMPAVGSMSVTLIDYIITGTSEDLRRSFRVDPGRFIGYVIQLAAGIVLFLHADRVAGWWGRRVRSD